MQNLPYVSDPPAAFRPSARGSERRWSTGALCTRIDTALCLARSPSRRVVLPLIREFNEIVRAVDGGRLTCFEAEIRLQVLHAAVSSSGFVLSILAAEDEAGTDV